jgi:ABC-type transport system involved in multi-copper enzyme maturation permease subunit
MALTQSQSIFLSSQGEDVPLAVMARARSKKIRMKQVLTIALNTFRESVRDKVLYNLIVFVFILIGASLYIGELSINQERKALIDLSLSVMLLFGYLIAVFIGTGLVYKEIDKRTIYSILSKPIQRHEFVLGKFVGLALTLFVNCAIMLAGILAVLAYSRGGFDAGLWNVVPTAFLLYLELLLATALALLFSSFTTPTLAVFFSIIGYIIGNFTSDLKLFADVMNVETYPSLKIAQTVLRTLYYLLPNLSNFNFITRTSHGIPVTGTQVGIAVLYFCAYLLILLSLTVAIFQRRNFK